MRILFIALTALILGCCPGAEWPIEFRLDEQWSEPEIAQLQVAMTEWYVATGAAEYTVIRGYPHGVDMDTWNGPPHIVHRMLESDPGVKQLRAKYPEFAGITSRCVGGGQIGLAIERIPIEDLHHVLLHELGHLYGFCGHQPNTLMDGHSEDDLDCIDSFVLEEICSSHDCVDPRTTCR